MIDKIKKIDKKLLQYYGISKLRLFGSYAKGTANTESDIDLLYEYDNNIDQSFAGIYGLYEILGEK